MVLNSLQPAGGSSGLKKLTIKYEKGFEDVFTGSIEAMFNPTEFQINTSLQWKTQGGSTVADKTEITQQFKSSVSKTVTIDLFFDTYEEHDTGLFAAIPSIDPFPTPNDTPVTDYTDPLFELATINSEWHRPPKCKLEWGDFKWGGYDNLFTGVLTQINQKFTMFMPSGIPVRATVTCSFVEADMTKIELFSADITKTYQVMPKDSLHSVAVHHYGNASQWRRIAHANQIINPRLLTPGMMLIIPTLT